MEEPLFLAQDVSEWIEHTNTTMMLKVVDEDEKEIHEFTTLNNNYGRERHLVTKKTFLTEDGIYEVLMQSRKPIAKQWKKEVKKILKQIRLTGGTVQTDREEEFIHNYFPSFSDEIKKAMVLDLRSQNKELKQTIQVQAPKVEKYEDYLETESSLTVTQVVDKLRELGKKPVYIRSATSLNKFLNAKGIQYKRGNSWYVYQECEYLVEEGFIVNRQVSVHNGYTNQLRWTPKGVDFIVDLLEKDKYYGRKL
nr:phage antirepressor KilAC domain-containing protein [Bacillus wiedmannii]